MYRLDLFHRHKEYLKFILPFGRILENPNVVINKNGSVQTTWSYRGPDLESAVMEQLGIMTAQLNSGFQTIGTGWVMYFEAQRTPSTSYATDVYFQDPVTKSIDEERKKLFSNGQHYESNYYMTLFWMPPDDAEGRLKEFVVEGRKRKILTAEDHLAVFTDCAEKIFRIFQDLRIPVHTLSKNEMATYLHSVVSSQRHAIKVPSKPMLLDQYLYDDCLTGGLEAQLGNKFMRVILPLTYPPISQFGVFNELNRLDFDYRWVTRFYCLDKTDALSELSSFQRGWNGKIKSFRTMLKELFTGYDDHSGINENAVMKVNEVKDAKNLVEADEVGYGFYSTMVIILDKNLEAVEEKAKTVEQIFLNLGMKPKIEDLNAVDAWLGSIPGNVSHHVRRPMVSTGNLVHMMPISDIWAGPVRNQHLNGPALLYTQTDGNTPFRLNLHVGDVGHTLLVGPTGAGKSVHLNMIAAQFRKYKNANIFIFDKGASTRILTEAVGGHFYDLANNKSDLSFQPLSQIDDENERMWTLDWLCDFIRNENVTITPEIKKLIWQALTDMVPLPLHYRTISNLIINIQDQKLKDAFRPLAVDGAYGSIFDSEKDTLTFSSWQSFEMEKLMNTPTIVGPTLMYIFHRIEQQLTGNPTIIVLDECWVFFDNPIFVQKIREWLKVLRKLNASVIFATQSMADIVDSPIFSTILESCQSRIFLPNDKALEKQTKEKYISFGLNERQIQIIASAVPKKQYYYTSPLGSRLYDLALGKTALAFVAVTKADLIECDHILNEYGKEGFLDHWKVYKNLSDGV